MAPALVFVKNTGDSRVLKVKSIRTPRNNNELGIWCKNAWTPIKVLKISGMKYILCYYAFPEIII